MSSRQTPLYRPAAAIYDHVDAPGLHRLRELDHVARALDVRHALGLRVGGHVIDRREVEQVVGLSPQPLDVGVGDAERRLGQVADDPDHAIGADSPSVAKLLEPPLRPLAHQHEDRALTLEQLLDEVPADEPCCAGDEVAHLPSSTVTILRRRPYTQCT
jgi:hypothetical protein